MHPLYIINLKVVIWFSLKCGYSEIVHITKHYKNDYKFFNFDKNKLDYENYLFVRNPINRIISCYINRYNEFYEQIGFDYTFKEFINLIYENKLNDKYGHLTPQFGGDYQLLINENPNFKFTNIYKIEEINFENIFCEKIFNVSTQHTFLNIRNETIKNNNIYIDNFYNVKKNEMDFIPNYKSFLNDDIVDKIKKIYKIDYDNFELYNIIY